VCKSEYRAPVFMGGPAMEGNMEQGYGTDVAPCLMANEKRCFCFVISCSVRRVV